MNQHLSCTYSLGCSWISFFCTFKYLDVGWGKTKKWCGFALAPKVNTLHQHCRITSQTVFSSNTFFATCWWNSLLACKTKHYSTFHNYNAPVKTRPTAEIHPLCKCDPSGQEDMSKNLGPNSWKYFAPMYPLVEDMSEIYARPLPRVYAIFLFAIE